MQNRISDLNVTDTTQLFVTKQISMAVLHPLLDDQIVEEVVNVDT